MQFRPSETLSPFKMEWSLEARTTECRNMLAKHPGRVPMVAECAYAVAELRRSKLCLPRTLTVAQAQRIIRSKAGVDRDTRLQLSINGQILHPQLLIEDVHNSHQDEDGFLYCTYSMEEACSTRKKEEPGLRKVFGLEWKSMYAWTPSGGWSVQGEGKKKEDAGGEVELIQIYSKKEQRARIMFQKKMRKRAAGPRDCVEVGSNLQQALSSCKLDTALSGMMQVAAKGSSSPGSCASTYLCGMPCALRVHTARPS